MGGARSEETWQVGVVRLVAGGSVGLCALVEIRAHGAGHAVGVGIGAEAEPIALIAVQSEKGFLWYDRWRAADVRRWLDELAPGAGETVVEGGDAIAG